MVEKYFGKIEARMGFPIPDLYLRMERDGVLHHGKDRVRLIEPPALSCTSGERSVYWLPPSEVAHWDPPEYWKEGNFVTFAGNGYGDYWCWYPELADSHGLPVVFCPHDYIEAEIFAPNFEAFLFRSVLESWIGIPESALGHFDGGKSDYKKFVEANIRTLEPYLNPQWVEALNRISERELTEHKYKLESLYSLLEKDEANALLKNFVTGRVGEPFRHMKD